MLKIELNDEMAKKIFFAIQSRQEPEFVYLRKKFNENGLAAAIDRLRDKRRPLFNLKDLKAPWFLLPVLRIDLTIPGARIYTAVLKDYYVRLYWRILKWHGEVSLYELDVEKYWYKKAEKTGSPFLQDPEMYQTDLPVDAQ